MRDEAFQPPAITLPAELMIWLSPSFPVGSFAYSHGLEFAVERAWVIGRDDLQAWLADLLAHGALRNDLILLTAAWRAIGAGHHSDSPPGLAGGEPPARYGEELRVGEQGASPNAVDTLVRSRSPSSTPTPDPSPQGGGGVRRANLCDINDLAIALQPSAERQLETVTQGSAFAATVAAAWPAAGLHMLSALPAGRISYPVAVGAVAAAHGIARDATALAYGVAFASSLVSAAIRLSLIGQTDGQRVISGLMPMLTEAARAAALSTLDDLGGATPRADLASLLHETQYTRLFRS